MASNIREHPIFLGSLEFETEGSPLSLTFWQGDKTYHFLTNFIGVYPIIPLRLSIEKKKTSNPIAAKQQNLEERLTAHGLRPATGFDVKQGEFYSCITNNDLAQFFMDKRDFSKLNPKLREEFAVNYKQSFLWDFGYLMKVDFEPWLTDILEEKNKLEKAFKEVHCEMLITNKCLMQPSVASIKEFIAQDYSKPEFEDKILPAALKEIGYEFSQEALEKIVHIFRETKYSLDNPHHFLNAEKKIFEPLGITRDHPCLKQADPKMQEEIDKYYAGIIGKSFSQRLFDNCNIVFGENWNVDRRVCSKSFDYVTKDDQEYLLNRLKELLRARPKYMGDEEYISHIKYQLEELFLKVKDLNVISKTSKEVRKFFSQKPVGSDNNQDSFQTLHTSELRARIAELEKSRQSLEQRIKGINPNNRLTYDYEHQRMLLFLDIMHRNPDSRIYFEGIKKKEMLSIDELLATPIAFLDIEKFQYGSIKEIISGCATLINNLKGEYHGQLDFLRPLTKDNIKGFRVKTHEFSKELVRSIAEFTNQAGTFLHITYGPYDFQHLKASTSFELGQSKEIEPRKRVHEKFVERYEVIGVFIDMMAWMRNITPQLINHRLATIINYLYEKAGSSKRFEKTHTHEQLRDDDKRAEQGMSSSNELVRKRAMQINDALGDYTVDDVNEMAKALLHPKNKYLFEDLRDVSIAFGITLDQAASNPNTANHLLEKVYHKRFGGFLSPGFYRQKFLETYEKFRNNYTEYKTDKLLEKGLKIGFERGIQKNVNMLYFSPEMLICEAIYYRYPEVEQFISKTLCMTDPERQASRLQYVKPLVINMLTELSIIEGKEKEIAILRNALAVEKSEKSKNEIGQKLEQAQTSLGKKKWFFKDRLFGVSVDYFKVRISQAYQTAADIMNQQGIKPLQIKGGFVFAIEDLPDEVLRQAGLFRVGKDMTIYNMRKNELTHRQGEQFAGFPSRLDRSTYHYSKFEINIIRNILDYVFKENYMAALRMISSAAWKLNDLEAMINNPMKEDNEKFMQSLLCYHREKARNFGVVGHKEIQEKKKDKNGRERLEKRIEYTYREYTPDARRSFRPDPYYYQGDFKRKFFGWAEGDSDIDANAIIPRLIGGIISLGWDNSAKSNKEYADVRQKYKKIILGRYCPESDFKNLLRASKDIEEGKGTTLSLFPEMN